MKTIFQDNGFTVHDLGKQVPIASRRHAPLHLSTALPLPVRERARIAHELILSLDDGADADAAEAWAAELEKRARSGSVKAGLPRPLATDRGA